MVLVRPDWWYRRQVRRYHQHRKWWFIAALVAAALQSAGVLAGGTWAEVAALTTGAPVVLMIGSAVNHGALRAVRLFAPAYLRPEPEKEPDQRSGTGRFTADKPGWYQITGRFTLPLRDPREGMHMGLTTDPNEPTLTHGPDPTDAGPVPQAETYLVLSDEEIGKGFVRPVRYTYRHETCGQTTTMRDQIAETYARQPGFYGATYCVSCGLHRPVGEFRWVTDQPASDDDPKVGS